jgi:hypothetical protein
MAGRAALTLLQCKRFAPAQLGVTLSIHFVLQHKQKTLTPLHPSPPKHNPNQKQNKRFIGEWYEPEPPHHAPTEEQIAAAAHSCFVVGGIYLGWVALAIGCVCFHSARSRVR